MTRHKNQGLSSIFRSTLITALAFGVGHQATAQNENLDQTKTSIIRVEDLPSIGFLRMEEDYSFLKNTEIADGNFLLTSSICL